VHNFSLLIGLSRWILLSWWREAEEKEVRIFRLGMIIRKNYFLLRIPYSNIKFYKKLINFY
jgi:hypothetical protein